MGVGEGLRPCQADQAPGGCRRGPGGGRSAKSVGVINGGDLPQQILSWGSVVGCTEWASSSAGLRLGVEENEGKRRRGAADLAWRQGRRVLPACAGGLGFWWGCLVGHCLYACGLFVDVGGWAVGVGP